MSQAAMFLNGAGGQTGAWRRVLIQLSIAAAAIVALYFGTFQSMVGIWIRSETFQHCFLVAPISLWLVWRKRASLAALVPVPSLSALALVGATGVLWLAGELVAVNALTQAAGVALLVLAVPTVAGWHVARAIAFPLGFLFLSVPFGEFVMPFMMDRTADFTVLALRASGIPVYQEGLHFIIPSGAWSVVEACSGVRYLIASFTVGLLFAYLTYRSLRRRLIFVAVSLAVPVLANWLRAYIIVMLGHLSGNKLATGVDHLIYGWLFFGIVIAIMFAIGARWAEDESADQGNAAPTSQQGGVATSRSLAWAGMPLMLLVAAMPVLAGYWIVSREARAAVPLDLPQQLADWRRVGGKFNTWEPEFSRPAAKTRATYERASGRVGVYVGFYRHQNYESKLVSSTNVLVSSENKEWALVDGGSIEARVGRNARTVRRAELRPAGSLAAGATDRFVVWHWYWINGRSTSSDREAKLWTAWSRLTGKGDDSAVVMVYAPKENAAGTLAEFLAANGEAIEAALARAAEAR